MALAIACILTTWEQFQITVDGQVLDAYKPSFADAIQSGEQWGNNLNELSAPPVVDIDNLTEAEQRELNTCNLIQSQIERHSVTDAINPSNSEYGIGIVYIMADNARVTAAEGLSDYHVLWRGTLDRQSDETGNDLLPTQDSETGDFATLRDYLVAYTGKSADTIAQYLANLYDVTPAQLLDELRSRPRTDLVRLLATAFTRWSDARGSLNTIEP